jgi:3-dehydroquinate synthase
VTGIERIVLIGFSGGGKTTVGRLLADRLGWTCVDTDELIEGEFGRTIPEIFAEEGEAGFRAAERRILARALAAGRVVIPTGGGAVALPDAWGPALLGRAGTLVVALDAAPGESLRRLREQHAASGSAVERPMLAGDDPLARIESLKAARQAFYDRAGLTLVVDRVPPEHVVDELIGLLPDQRADAATTVLLDAPSGRSLIRVEGGLVARLGELIRAKWPGARRCWIVSDDRVSALHGDALQALLTAADLEARLHAVPAGEGSKSLQVLGQLWDWMLDGGVERGDVVVALGGGMVGDLAGFVAATVLRGVGLVQVPTSLLATVDSSVGGKTGINHRTGKNLIGAFYQPPLVAIDPDLLRTLPPRELTSGWAEIVKHALIQPSTPGGERADLMGFLERNADNLLRLGEPAISYLIHRNVALKAAVVAADERETGIRAYLNFGHTFGHSIEAADYSLLHGEAVAVGMRGAARLGVLAGTFDEAGVARLDALLDRFGLPRAAKVSPDRVQALIGSDKKRAAGRQRWVLPLSAGGVTIRDDVPEALVRSALLEVVRG